MTRCQHRDGISVPFLPVPAPFTSIPTRLRTVSFRPHPPRRCCVQSLPCVPHTACAGTAVNKRRNVVFFAARRKYNAPAINYTFSSHVRNFAAQFTQCSNACTRIFIVCKISKAYSRGSRRNKFRPRGIPVAPISIPPRYSHNIYPYSRGFPAESARLSQSPFLCRPLTRTGTHPESWREDRVPDCGSWNAETLLRCLSLSVSQSVCGLSMADGRTGVQAISRQMPARNNAN